MALPTATERLLSDASRALSRFAGHQRVLEAMALRRPLAEVLTRLVETIEEASPGTHGSVLLLDETGRHVRTGAAPHLPPAFVQAIDGLAIGPEAGSCGTAAYRGEPVVVEDIASDPRWAPYRDATLPHGLAACWSTPITGSDGAVLGTFAQYSYTPRAPTAEELRVLDDARDLASVAIQLAQAERSLASVSGQLQAAQRMQAVGRLAGGLAHDFNNLLTIVGGNLTLALAQVAAGTPLHEVLGEARDATSRAAALARQLRTFSRGEPVVPEIIDLGEWARSMAPEWQALLGARCTLALDLTPTPTRIRIDRAHLGQLLHALLTNAGEAIEGTGTVTVSVQHEFGSDGADHVTIGVADTGRGMDEETRRRAFEPFTAARAAGAGVGLGLPTVFAIVARHGGDVRIDSAPAHGCMVRLRFPAHASAAPPTGRAAGRAASETPLPAGATVLLVEDEDALRRLMSRVLSTRGYRVLEARDGVEALEVWHAHRGHIASLVTDVMMPRLGGAELATRLRAERPALPVLFCSGYTDTFDFDMEHSTSPTVFLAKPFTMRALTEQVDGLRA